MDPWLICHLANLVDKIGITLAKHSRGFYISNFVDSWRQSLRQIRTQQRPTPTIA
ncbi:hypothetical protein PGTUg99_007058 [Puccinia graminis f. sp. tritici]|uniref:Uncharacterized protein n=1 Tax=Puccinia graminis f. sp. tritici TaxID=56615 RepID=A0A5B0RKK4_PUCGR|nr:hypothetical protein PGTUg99_007058 [Puccinia graminis f. sp. tritici]